MDNDQKNRKFDLEDRTLNFSKKVIDLLRKLPKDTINYELTSQVIRSSGSMGANYREANDSLGKKDFCMRVRICRKESKETKYWLELISHNNPLFNNEIVLLIGEAMEFIKIFSAIIKKSI